MLIASNLGIANYFNPESVSIDTHIVAHILGISIDAVVLAVLAAVGFALGRRKPALNSQPA